MSDRRRICIMLPCSTLNVLDNLVYQARRGGVCASRSSVIAGMIDDAVPSIIGEMEEEA